MRATRNINFLGECFVALTHTILTAVDKVTSTFPILGAELTGRMVDQGKRKGM